MPEPGQGVPFWYYILCGWNMIRFCTVLSIRPGGFPVAYTVSSGVESTKLPKKKDEAKLTAAGDIDQTAQEAAHVVEKAVKDFSKAMREAKVKYLKEMAGTDSFMPLVTQLVAEDPAIEGDLSFQQALLVNAEVEASRSSEV